MASYQDVAITRLGRVPEHTAMQVFKQTAETIGLDPAIMQHFVTACKCRTLDDFRFLLSNKSVDLMDRHP